MLTVAMALALVAVPSPAPSVQEPFTQDGVPPVDLLDPRETPPISSALAAAATPKNLNLGDYALFAPPPRPVVDLARFDTAIEVEALMPRDPNEAMADWWRHWNFEYSIYGRGINIQKPMPGGGFNILPLIEWLGKKAKEGDRNRTEE
jgi:hypothetical protein